MSPSNVTAASTAAASQSEADTDTGSRGAHTASSATQTSWWWMRLGTLPVVIAAFVLLNAGYILLVGFGNITDFGTNQAFVHHVLAMDTTNFGAGEGKDLDPDVMWRAIGNETVQNIGYVAIIVWEVAAGIVLTAAFVFWILDRGTAYRRARALSSIGLLMIIVLFVGGFVVMGGEWFQMWKSVEWNGLDTAFRNIVIASIPLILIHLPSAIWQRGDHRAVAASDSVAE